MRPLYLVAHQIVMICLFAGWSDGKIRAFMPESGKEMFTQEEAHAKGVTALASYSDCRHIVSGGGEGSVRVWQIGSGQYSGQGQGVSGCGR